MNVSKACHREGKRLIVIINSSSAIETATWSDYADAILVAWQPGEEGGNSVADILTGKVNPSGKLTMTWPVFITDNPSTFNFPSIDNIVYIKRFVMNDYFEEIPTIHYSNHDEDIYVGYRYFDTFGKKVAYPFGFGLSYTTFDYSDTKAKFNTKESELEVAVKVTNSGKTEGKEAVQIYVSAPKGLLEKPSKELKAFAKTKLLKPGESETLKMRIPIRDLASFDESKSQWLVEAGKYKIWVGSSCADIRGKIEADIPTYTEKVSDVLHLKTPISPLRQQSEK